LVPFEAEPRLKHLARTSNKTEPIMITNINLLMLFWEISSVYYENHMNPINTLCGQNEELLIVKAGGTYAYHKALNVKIPAQSVW
jgi:hypothetical protein